MKRVWILPIGILLGLALAVSPAQPQSQSCQVGGHNETSENFAPGGWATVNFGPGCVSAGLSSRHLMISEVAPRGGGAGSGADSSEYVEIYNPTASAVPLEDFYLADDNPYFRIVNGSYSVAQNTDFVVRFPAGAVLNAGQAAVVCVTKQGYFGSGMATPGCGALFFEMCNTNANTADDMVLLTPNSQLLVTGGMMTNPAAANGEWVMLFCWDRSSDRVSDIDYASWGANAASNPKVDKTGVSIDGSDADVLASVFNPDMPVAAQTNLGTSLTRPLTWQRAGAELGEVPAGGNGNLITVSPSLAAVDWTTQDGLVRLHTRWANSDPESPTAVAAAQMWSQQFGVFLPDLENIASFSVPPIAPSSFFDVFTEVPLGNLPPSPQKVWPGGLPPPGTPCPRDTNWNGNLDIAWNLVGGGGGGGRVNKHYGDLIVRVGGDPSYIHMFMSTCAGPKAWSVGGACPGITMTLVNEDLSPAPNPVPAAWTGFIKVTAAAGAPAPSTCCETVTFTCLGQQAVIDLCINTCTWSRPPTLSAVDWKRLGDVVRFHQRWKNPDPLEPSDRVSGELNSQEFGAFLPTVGTIGVFEVPPIEPESFFDVFTDVSLAQLPPEPARVLPGGGPPVGWPCPPDSIWTGNVDVIWTDPYGATGNEHHHHGELLVRPGATPSLLHMLVGCNVLPGATWAIVGLCPGWTATLLEEDKVTPAGNPLGVFPPPGFPGWTGYLAVTAPAGTAPGTKCCFQIQFVCNGVPGVIHMCVTVCDWTVLHPVLTSVDWRTIGTSERFHLRWENSDPTRTSVEISGEARSQQFGVFAENAGTLGAFNVPPLAPQSFFDVFFDVPLTQLPPEPPKQLPGGGPLFPGPCPPDTFWIGNVDIQWVDPFGGAGVVNHHHGAILVRPGPTPSLLHLFVGCAIPPGATWAVVGVLPGWSATLVQEDKVTPAPNPLGVNVPPLPPWTGWIAITAPAGTPVGTVCCFQIQFVCNGVPGVIQLCATVCNWVNTDVPLPPKGMEFGIYAVLPNPTTGATLVGFALPTAGRARLDVYDLAGKHVRTLMDGIAPAGPNSVRWNGAADNGHALRPGTYFVTLRSDGRFTSHKVIMVR